MYFSLVAHTAMDVELFAHAEIASALWARLKRGAPHTVAACIMPSHVHELVETSDPRAAWLNLSKRLAAFSRTMGWKRAFLPLKPPQQIPNDKHLRRSIRYTHLNPCRDRLVRDPLLWPWSTHRGVLGAELEPWVDAERMAEVFGRAPEGFAEWFHHYVSADSDAAVDGTPMPAAAPSTPVPAVPLTLVVKAANAMATDPALRRRIAVILAYDQGWHCASWVAAALGVSARHVRRVSARADPALLRIARLYLGDPRLRFRPFEVHNPDIFRRSGT